MKRKPFIAGNWKMNNLVSGARRLASQIAQMSGDVEEAALAVFPPFTALDQVKKAVADTRVMVGAQDIFWEDAGAFTGEISAAMVRDLGCSHVIIGHSERRQYARETDADVNRKIRAALRHGLSPIVCVGESLKEWERGESLSRVESQLEAGLHEIDAADMVSVIIAYEPIWAIGTGLTAEPDQAEKVHARIREWIEEKYGAAAADCAIILYGGSVKPSNAASLFMESNIDGFLVGGASLEAESFIGIASEAIRTGKDKK
ncbi:MAG: triose-phosphate isomerase [Acidobacteriota bacterium]|nr:triose-phosphate isomerase [Acidobacteriota bacterium]